MDQYTGLLPEKFRLLFPYMKEQNWLYNYRTRQGTEKSLGGVVRRALYLQESHTAFRLFEQHYEQLGSRYRIFWPALKLFAMQQFNLLSASQ